MRHCVRFKGNSQIKTADLVHYIPSLQEGDTLRMTCQQQNIYLVYRPTLSSHQPTAEINSQLLQLNGIDNQGNCIIQSIRTASIQHLVVEVSQLDWKIVNLKQLSIAQSVLEQVSVVWPSAKLPIYYDQTNFVVLQVVTQKVGKLQINSTIQFIEKAKTQMQHQPQADYQNSFNLLLKQIIDDQAQGYLNKIKINQSLFKRLNLTSGLWIVQNNLQFTACPTIQMVTDLQKSREAAKQIPNLRKLIVVQASQLLQQDQFECSNSCRQLLYLSESISVCSDKQRYCPKVATSSFQLFVTQPHLIIEIQQIVEHQNAYSQQQFQLQKHKIITQFTTHFIDILTNNQPLILLQQAYPYLLQGKLFTLTLKDRQEQKTITQFHSLVSIGNDIHARKSWYADKLAKQKIVFKSSNQPNTGTLQNQYDQIEKWITVLKTHHMQSDNKINKLYSLFQSIYSHQINQIAQFITDKNQSKPTICLISSFGTNGKSLMHTILQIKNHKMWKIDFISLNSPQLTFKDIDFYLHWTVFHTPYPLIYIDNVDALCSKIEESDQHRRKQKVISKLIIRKLMKYLTLYNKKCILTAKSQANIDEQLVGFFTINLKNPGRQLRVKAMRQLYGKHIQAESPIKRFNQDQDQPVDQSLIQTLSDNTQSLTFAAFSKCAIQLTLPASNHVAVSDFSKLAGLSQAKQTIKAIIQKPIKYSFLFKSAPIKLPRGILLFGATGNGKSAIGAALQGQFKMKYFSVKGSDILSKYIGGSQAAVREVFQKALSVSPSIIFFDQFESIVPRRSANNTGVNDRIVNQFLCYLDGVSAISGVFIIAASSRPDLIDPAIIRPGRLDAHIFLDYPNTEERLELIRLFSNSVKINLDEQIIVQATANYNYSDMIGLFKQLRIKRSSEVLNNSQYQPIDFITIDQQLFFSTTNSFKLSVSPNDQQQQRKIFQSFQSGISPNINKQRQIQM